MVCDHSPKNSSAWKMPGLAESFFEFIVGLCDGELRKFLGQMSGRRFHLDAHVCGREGGFWAYLSLWANF